MKLVLVKKQVEGVSLPQWYYQLLCLFLLLLQHVVNLHARIHRSVCLSLFAYCFPSIFLRSLSSVCRCVCWSALSVSVRVFLLCCCYEATNVIYFSNELQSAHSHTNFALPFPRSTITACYFRCLYVYVYIPSHFLLVAWTLDFFLVGFSKNAFCLPLTSIHIAISFAFTSSPFGIVMPTILRVTTVACHARCLVPRHGHVFI